MARHICNSHGDIAEIAKLPNIPKKDHPSRSTILKQRKVVLDKYRNLGDFNHNIGVLSSGTGVLFVGRRPTDR